MAGELKLVTSFDLKGLGAKESQPLMYNWTLPSLMPVFLPWLAVLGLLALRPNRTGRAWWIWLPLALTAGASLFQQLLGEKLSISGEMLDTFGQVVAAGAFGVAGVWLLGFLLRDKPWPLVFLGVLLLQTVVSVLAQVVAADFEEIVQAVGMTFFQGLCGLSMALALTLAALVCRRRYAAGRFTLWTLFFLLGAWLLGALPFCLIGLIAASGSFAPVTMFLAGAAGIGVACFLVLLPFLLLAFANTFYRERFVSMFGLKGPSPAPPPLPGILPAPQTL